MRERLLAKILSQISEDVWENIVKREPEWQNMKPFLPRLSFGPFATLMVVTGLNDYQLKGKAEVAYWPKIRDVLQISPCPKSTQELGDLLRPFYQTERMNRAKIQRLGKFLVSPLAHELWEASAGEVSGELLNICCRLESTMHQDHDDKTIAFAMKCLGISLLMANEYRFHFSGIPIPVDSRVEQFTRRLEPQSDTATKIRRHWDDVLSILRVNNPCVTMIHLDSLIWQIAPLSEYHLRKYFSGLGISQVGEKLCALLQP